MRPFILVLSTLAVTSCGGMYVDPERDRCGTEAGAERDASRRPDEDGVVRNPSGGAEGGVAPGDSGVASCRDAGATDSGGVVDATLSSRFQGSCTFGGWCTDYYGFPAMPECVFTDPLTGGSGPCSLFGFGSWACRKQGAYSGYYEEWWKSGAGPEARASCEDSGGTYITP